MIKFGKIVYKEVFKSAFQYPTKAGALHTLNVIREVHDASHGWEEISGYAEELPNGKWRAVRHHVKHKLVYA